jgi:putative phosphoesterase
MGMRIGVLSDTHIHQVSKDFRDLLARHFSQVDVIFHVGDYTSPVVVDYLGSKDFHGVYGNMDPYAIREALPEKKIVEIGGFRFGLIHGWGSPHGLEERVLAQFSEVDVIVFGHSHRAMNEVVQGVLLFNPGTATGFSSSGVHTVGILECGDTVEGKIIDLDPSTRA